MNRKQHNLKEYLEKYYDYVSLKDVLKINKEFSYGCSIPECKQVSIELGWSEYD